MIDKLDESEDYKQFLKNWLELEKSETTGSDIKYGTEGDKRTNSFLSKHDDGCDG